jgi:hypothetical protein
MTDTTIEFTAQVIKVQTMHADNTIRLTLDMNETETMVMAQLAECARFGVVMRIIATMEQKNDRRITDKHRNIHI